MGWVEAICLKESSWQQRHVPDKSVLICRLVLRTAFKGHSHPKCLRGHINTSNQHDTTASFCHVDCPAICREVHKDGPTSEHWAITRGYALNSQRSPAIGTQSPYTSAEQNRNIKQSHSRSNQPLAMVDWNHTGLKLWNWLELWSLSLRTWLGPASTCIFSSFPRTGMSKQFLMWSD